MNRHQDLAATSAFGQRTAPTQQQWGGSFGGPIRPDRTFFFGAYEQQEVSVPRAVLFDGLQGFNGGDTGGVRLLQEPRGTVYDDE